MSVLPDVHDLFNRQKSRALFDVSMVYDIVDLDMYAKETTVYLLVRVYNGER